MYVYGEAGLPIGFKYRTTGYAIGAFDSYVFEKNLQGDIVAIYNTSGTSVAIYKYDAWGNVISETGTMASVNPFRYRGYYYDTETGFYYLQSRYYDPAIGRFINADNANVIHTTPTALTDKNLYAYCDNNPVMRIDEDGEFWLTAIAIGFFVGVIAQYVSDVIDNIQEGETGEDILRPKSSLVEYIASGVSGAIAAIPVSNFFAVIALGATGNVIGDIIRGDISSISDVAESAFNGAVANGIGYGFSKLAANIKVNRINSMNRSSKKTYLRDVFYKNSQNSVNTNLITFQNNPLKQVEERFWVYKSGFYSTVTSTGWGMCFG